MAVFRALSVDCGLQRFGKRALGAIMLSATVLLAACGDSDKKDETAKPDQQQSGAAAGQQAGGDSAEQLEAYRRKNVAYAEEYRKGDDVVVLDSGVAFKYLKRGPEDGEQPTLNDLVAFYYEGKLISGETFDKNTDADEPLTFPLARLIEGWQQAIPEMRTGDVIELMVPAELGYGSRAQGDIPANSTLLFRIDLRDVLTEEEWLENFKADQRAYLAENAEKDDVTVTESGLQYRVIRLGEGEKPGPDAVVTAHYEGKFVNGDVFETTFQRGKPAEFPLDEVIPGWTEGVQLMPVGSVFEFTIPYELGYGERGSGRSIPGFATLIFTIELVSFESRKEEWAEREQLIAADKAFMADFAKKDGVVVLEDGTAYKITEQGDGRKPAAGDVVSLVTVGRLRDGTVFEDVTDHPSPKIMLMDRTIPGLATALAEIPEGSRFEIAIPQERAFGKEETGDITPFSTLIYEGKLVAVRTREEEQARLEQLRQQAEAWFERQKQSGDYTVLESGALVRPVDDASGRKASDLARIKFVYVAMLRDGTIVQDTRGTNPTVQAVGSYNAALAEAFQQMAEGGVYEVVLPYQQAFGAGGRGKIPPYSPVIYEVTMQRILEKGEKLQPQPDA